MKVRELQTLSTEAFLVKDGTKFWHSSYALTSIENKWRKRKFEDADQPTSEMWRSSLQIHEVKKLDAALPQL